MKKKLIFIFFGLLILAIPIYLTVMSETVLEEGYRHKIQLAAYDPFDPFRGKYLRLNYDNRVPCDSSLSKGDNAYISLAKDEKGFSYFAYASSEKPEGDDYFEARIERTFDSIEDNWFDRNFFFDNEDDQGKVIQARFKTNNISKYFINENKASEAEGILQEYQREHPDDIYVAIRVLDGEIRLEDIFVEETPLLEFLSPHDSL